MEGGDSLRKVGFFMLGVTGGLLLLLPGLRLPWTRPVWWLSGAVLLLMIASALWSVDPGLCVKRIVVGGLIALAVGGAVRQMTARQTADWLTALMAAYVVLGLACEVLLLQFRPWSGAYRFGGTTHPNTQGVICGLLFCSMLSRATLPSLPRRGRWLLATAAAALVLYLTKSRTAFAAALLAGGLLVWMRATWSQRLASLVVSGTLLLAAVVAGLMLNLDSMNRLTDVLLLGRSEEASTLTGRLPLWEELSDSVAARPLLGHGFGSYWTPGTVFRVSDNQGWQIPHAHSGYFETLLNLGVVGLGLILLTLGSSALHAAAADFRQPRAESGLTMTFVLFALVYSLADTAFALPTLASFSLALLVVQSCRLGEEWPAVADDRPAACS